MGDAGWATTGTATTGTATTGFGNDRHGNDRLRQRQASATTSSATTGSASAMLVRVVPPTFPVRSLPRHWPVYVSPVILTTVPSPHRRSPTHLPSYVSPPFSVRRPRPLRWSFCLRQGETRREKDVGWGDVGRCGEMWGDVGRSHTSRHRTRHQVATACARGRGAPHPATRPAWGRGVRRRAWEVSEGHGRRWKGQGGRRCAREATRGRRG